MSAEGNFEGHNILNRLKHLPRSTEDESDGSPTLRDKLLARAREAGPARARRQGAGGLERADDRRAGQCRRRARRAVTGSQMAARAFRCSSHAKMTHGDRLGHSWRDGKLLFPGLASDSRRHDPRRAGAATRPPARHAYLERALAWQGALRPRITPIPTTAAISSPPTTPKAWWCGRASTTDDATPNPNAHRGAEPRPPRRAHRPARLARQGRPPVRGHRCQRAGENLFGIVALLNALDLRLRAAEIVVTGTGRARDRAADGRAASCRTSTASCCAPHATLPTSHPAQEKIKAATRRARRSSASARRCSLPVTDPDALAKSVTASRPHASSA